MYRMNGGYFKRGDFYERKRKNKKIWTKSFDYSLYDYSNFYCEHVIIVNRYKSNKYQRAVELMNEGSIVEAYAVLSELKGYQDSKERMYSIRKQYLAVCFAAVKEGDTVFFGRFEQDGNLTNGAEEIEWIVLEHRADRVLLLSRFVLVPMPFHDEYTEISHGKIVR